MDSKFDLNSFNSDRLSDCSQSLSVEDLIQFGPSSGSGSDAETRLRQFLEQEPRANDAVLARAESETQTQILCHTWTPEPEDFDFDFSLLL